MSNGSRTKKRLTGRAETERLSAEGRKGLKLGNEGMAIGSGRSLGRFQTLLDEAPIGICNIDLKGKITYANKRFEEVSGYSRQEVIGQNGFKLGMFSAESLKLLAKRLSERLMGSPHRLLEVQFKCKDGHWIWVEMEGKILKERGLPVGFQLIAGDINERKQTEEALRAEKDKLQSIIGSIEYGISTVDREYNILYQSQPSPWDGSFQVGEKCYRVYEGREEVCEGCPVEKAFRDGKSHTVERKVVRPWGEVIYVESTANPLKDEKGEVTSCLEVSRDVTEHKRISEAIQAEKDKLQSVIDAMEYGIDIRDKEYNISYQNEKSRQTFGGNHAGEKCYRAYADRDTLCDDCPVEKAFKDGKSHTVEKKLVLPSGETVYWDNVASPVKDAKGNVTSCLEVIRDITDRKMIEQALQVEKDRLQTVIDALGYGLTIQDRNYKIIYQNEMSRKVSGGSHLGEKCYQAFEGREEVCEGCPVRQALTLGKSHTAERKMILPSGRMIYWEIVASPLKDAKGNVTSCIEVIKDVTKRKQAETKLRESETSLVEAQKVAKMGSWSLDLATGEGSWSAEMFRLMGFDPSEEPPAFEDFVNCIHPEDRESFLRDFHEKVKQTGESGTFEMRSNPERGPVSYFLANVSANCDSQGNVVKLMGTLQDITERKRMEEVLRASEEELKKMFESVTDGIWVIDLKGVITKVNDRAATMHGFTSREEVVGKNALELVAPVDRARIRESIQKVVKGGVARDVEYTMLKADGSEFPSELSTNALRDADGNCIGHITVSRDITERKRIEWALRSAEEKYKNLVEANSDMTWEVDENGLYTFVGPSIKDILGYEIDEVVGKIKTLDFTPQKGRGKWLKVLRDINNKREPFSGIEIPHLRKDGTPIIFEVGGVPCFDAEGEFKGFIGVNKDVTERKRAEEELKLRAQMLDIASDSILVHDGKRFSFANEAACRAHGYSREEFLGMKLPQLIPEDQRGNLAANERRDARQKGVGEVDFEADHLRKDGSLMPVEVRSRTIRLGGRKLVLAIVRDITERKRAEEELKLRAQMLDGATDTIFVHDMDENLVYVNEAACRLHGYSREEFMKKKMRQLVPPDQLGSFSTLKEKTVAGGVVTFETIHLRKDGSAVPLEVNSRIIESGGEKLVLAIARDVTGRKRAEAEKSDLEQKAHLASRLASVGEMASGIAHEINNPLTAVIGFSQLLMDAEIPDDTREDIAIIHKEAQRAAGVARNLLTFARKHAPSKQPTDLNGIIEGVLKLRAYEQNVSNIQIKTKLAPDLPEVLGDYSQLQQVFINLILNAEGAMLDANNGGTLTITTQQVNGIVRASFADNGPGITEENLKRIFDPFFTTKEVGKGTGLGLSVCHGIITEHKGKIYAKSKEGSGATFIVELPISS